MAHGSSLNYDVWIVSANTTLSERLQNLLLPLGCSILHIQPESLDDDCYWRQLDHDVKLIVLDVDHTLDWGEHVIQRLHQKHYNAPLVVMTANDSTDFARKIISQGIRYRFLHDFDSEEFIEVARCLLQLRQAK